jgi:hypothetical protein
MVSPPTCRAVARGSAVGAPLQERCAILHDQGHTAPAGPRAVVPASRHPKGEAHGRHRHACFDRRKDLRSRQCCQPGVGMRMHPRALLAWVGISTLTVPSSGLLLWHQPGESAHLGCPSAHKDPLPSRKLQIERPMVVISLVRAQLAHFQCGRSGRLASGSPSSEGARASVPTLCASASDSNDQTTDDHKAKAKAKARKYGRCPCTGNRD